MKTSLATFPNDLVAIKKLAHSAFSSTPDSSLEEWFSFDEMIHVIEQNRTEQNRT